MVDTIKINQQQFVTKQEGTLRDIYKIGKVLGEGAYGEVRLVTHRDSKEKRACKVLKKEKLDKEEIQKLSNEIRVLKGLDHPNIVKIYEFMEDEKRIYIVTELIEGGELFDGIIEQGKFNEN